MEVNYTPATDPALLDPLTLSQQLTLAVDDAHAWLATLTGSAASTPLAPGKWSTKQVIGHLTDSAVNNLARFVRAQIAPEPLPTYGADAWVDLQHYADRDWPAVLALWLALNQHIAWTVRHIPLPSLPNPITVGGVGVTLGFLVEDYIAHLHHHLRSLPRPAA